MSDSGEFIKGTIVKGLLFLIPVAVVLVIFNKAIELIAKLAHPLTSRLTVHTVWGVGVSDLVAIATLVVVMLVAGLIAQTRAGAAINHTLERLILRKMPGYTLLKSLDTHPDGAAGHPNASVALAGLNGAWTLGFIMEEHANGMRTVFVPRAPTPAAGNLYFVTENQLRRLNMPVMEAMKTVTRLGVGSKEILESYSAAGTSQQAASKGMSGR